MIIEDLILLNAIIPFKEKRGQNLVKLINNMLKLCCNKLKLKKKGW